MKTKFPDLTTSSQKTVAFGLVCVLGVILYFILPPMIVLMKNLYLALAYGIPLLIVAYNYPVIWEYAKKLSWDMTKKLISSDPLWYMYRYVEYLDKKTERLEMSIRDILGIRNMNARKLVELQNEVQKYTIQVEKKDLDEMTSRILKTKIANAQKSIDRILPIITSIDTQTEQLKEVLKYWRADNEILKAELDGKSQEYKIMKELSNASKTASFWLGDNSNEMKMFKESVAQIESSISNYAANVEMFEASVLPKLSMAGANFNYNVEEGERIIEKLKNERLNF